MRNLNGGMIVYQQSIAGMMNTKTIDTLQIQSDGTFTLTLPVEDYERAEFHFVMEKRYWVRLYRRRKNTIGCRCNGLKNLWLSREWMRRRVAVSRLLNRLNAAVWDLRAASPWQTSRLIVDRSAKDYLLSKHL